MATLSKETVKVAAEAAGITGLAEEVAGALAPDVEYRLREILQEATRFQRHARRATLTTADINAALRLKNLDPVYGHSSRRGAPAWTPVPVRQQAGGASGVYREDEEILDVADVSRTAAVRALRFPLAPTLAVHWLAVEGIQPHIPQNLTSTAIKARQERAQKRRRAQQAASNAAGAGAVVNATLPGAVVRPVVKHVLAKELQLYYEKITTIIMEGKSADLVHAAMTSLATDGGLHEIVPYMTQFVADEVTQNLRNVALLSRLMRAARGLLVNGNVHIEPYLHQLIPPILTCIVGQRLCEGPWEDHWGLRDYAAGLVALICQRFGKAYTELQGRITKSLSHAFLDPNRPLTTQYGAIVAIGALGPRVSAVLVKPNLEFYLGGLTPLLASENPVERAEAGKCHGALLRCCGQIVHRAPTTDAYDELVEPFGESLLPYVSAAPTSQFLSV